MTESDLTDVWARSLDGLVELHIQPSQLAWLKLTRPLALVENTALIATPNAFVKEQLETRLRSLVTHVLSRELGRSVQIAVTVDPSPGGPAPQPAIPDLGPHQPGPLQPGSHQDAPAQPAEQSALPSLPSFSRPGEGQGDYEEQSYEYNPYKNDPYGEPASYGDSRPYGPGQHYGGGQGGPHQAAGHGASSPSPMPHGPGCTTRRGPARRRIARRSTAPDPASRRSLFSPSLSLTRLSRTTRRRRRTPGRSRSFLARRPRGRRPG